jgi:hypothetical protein
MTLFLSPRPKLTDLALELQDRWQCGVQSGHRRPPHRVAGDRGSDTIGRVAVSELATTTSGDTLRVTRLSRSEFVQSGRLVSVQDVGVGHMLGIRRLLPKGEPGIPDVKAPGCRTFSPHGSLPVGPRRAHARSLPCDGSRTRRWATEPKPRQYPTVVQIERPSLSGSAAGRHRDSPKRPAAVRHVARAASVLRRRWIAEWARV